MDQPETIRDAALWLAGIRAANFTGHRVERAEFGKTWGPAISA